MNYKKKSIFKTFFISFILIGAIPLVVLGSLFYYYNVIDYEKNVKETNFSKLVQVKNQIDLDIKVLKDITYHISNNAKLLEADKTKPEERERNYLPTERISAKWFIS